MVPNIIPHMLIALGLIILGIVIVTSMVFHPDKVRAIQRKLTPAEEAKFELHPTVSPYTMEITDENVRDVINITIEDGLDHPALAARKG